MAPDAVHNTRQLEIHEPDGRKISAQCEAEKRRPVVQSARLRTHLSRFPCGMMHVLNEIYVNVIYLMAAKFDNSMTPITDSFLHGRVRETSPQSSLQSFGKKKVMLV